MTQRKKIILFTLNENGRSEATPSALSLPVSGGLESKDDLMNRLQESHHAAKNVTLN